MSFQQSKQLRERMVSILSAAIDGAPWQQSKFLANSIKPMQKLRDHLLDELATQQQVEVEKTPEHLAKRFMDKTDFVPLYVSLYVTQGNNLPRWEHLLHNLDGYISRPVYRLEADVQALVRDKVKLQNQAYICIYVKEQDILQVAPAQELTDRLGKKMVTLRENALNPDNIVLFVHMSIKYSLSNGRLIKHNDVQSS